MRIIINKFLNKLGYELKRKTDSKEISFYNDYGYKIGYEYEYEANKIIKIIRKYTMLPYINLITLFEQVIYCEKNKIQGAFVECGVWKGGAIGLMTYANLNYGINRREIHLFDAFEEICAPNETNDGEVAINEVKEILGRNALTNGELIPLKGLYDRFGGPSDLNQCKDLIENVISYPAEYVHYNKGWFQEKVPEVVKDIDEIAILRLDGDWYESTKVCLDNLYDKVVKGGFIIIDDYGLYSGCKKAVDDFLKQRKLNPYLHYSSASCRYFQKI